MDKAQLSAVDPKKVEAQAVAVQIGDVTPGQEGAVIKHSALSIGYFLLRPRDGDIIVFPPNVDYLVLIPNNDLKTLTLQLPTKRGGNGQKLVVVSSKLISNLSLRSIDGGTALPPEQVLAPGQRLSLLFVASDALWV